jgi:serine/threonine-protein kinase
VLYEMLVGDPPHVASTPQAILGKIITEPPPAVTKARKSVPPNVEAAIARALEKVPADRFGTASDLATSLSDPGFRYGQAVGRGVAGAPGVWNRLTIALAGLAALSTLALTSTLLRSPTVSMSLPVQRFALDIAPGHIAVLPDGSGVTYVSEGQVMLRRWDSLDPLPVSGADGVRGGSTLAISPNGSEIAYIDGDQQLKVIPIQGGVSRTLASPAFCCVTWPSDGHIYYSPPVERNIRRVPAAGGPSDDVTQRGADEANQGFMNVLPGGEWGLVSTTRPFLTSTGHLVWVSRQGQLVAAAFDADQRALTGQTVPLINLRSRSFIPMLSLSRSGTLVYVEAVSRSEQRLVVTDLDGNEDVLALGARPIGNVSWLPDGESVIYSSDGQVYTYDVVLNATPRQLTFEGSNRQPVVSPDGSSVVFTSTRPGRNSPDLWIRNLSDDSPAVPLLPDLDSETSEEVTHWPSDSLIAIRISGPQMASDLWTVDLSEPGRPQVRPYLSSEATLRNLVISADGTMAAYVSDETGRDEVYVRSFPEPGAPTQVSGAGGGLPVWSPNESVLYYRGSEVGALMAARMESGVRPVVLSLEEVLPSVSVGAPTIAFLPLHPDGDRLIFARDVNASSADAPAGDRVILVQNFFEELKRLAPN